MDRREFLTGASAILTGVSRPAPAESLRGRDRAYLTPNHRHEPLTAVPAADGVRLRRAMEDEASNAKAIMLGIFRYDRSPQVFRRLVLPWAKIRGGLYVRSSVAYQIRSDLDLERGLGFWISVVLDEPATVAIYQETSLVVEGKGPYQVVVAIGPIEERPA